jgi:hypothetical protein
MSTNNGAYLDRSPTPSSARRGNLLVGCGVVLVIVVVALVVAGVWVSQSWRGWTSSAIRSGTNQVLTEARIDPIEQQEIMVHVDELMNKFENGDITLEQLGTIAEQIAKSPIVPAAMVIITDNLYIDQSELSDEEKADARIQLARYAQGVKDKDIDPESAQEVLDPISTDTPDSNDIVLNITYSQSGKKTRALRSPDQVSADDLRAVVEKARTFADEAGVSETPDEIDLSDELGAAIDRAMGNAPALPDSDDAPSAPDQSADTSDDPASTEDPDPTSNDGP